MQVAMIGLDLMDYGIILASPSASIKFKCDFDQSSEQRFAAAFCRRWQAQYSPCKCSSQNGFVIGPIG